MKLSNKILLGMILGVILGLLLRLWSPPPFIYDLFEIIGNIFLKLLKMLIVPVVFVALVCGVSKISESKQLGRLGIKTFSLFIILNFIAVSMALILATTFRVGSNVNIPIDQATAIQPSKNIKDVILEFIPNNPIEAMTQNNLIPIIILAILFGVALSMSGEKGKFVFNLFDSLNCVLIKIILIVMKIAPYGVFCLITILVSTLGSNFVGGLFAYLATTLLTLLIHIFGVYPLFLRFLAKLSPIIFFKKMQSTMLFALSTSSSNATIPINMETAKEKLGVDEITSAFIIPLGANVHLNGTGIMQGVAAVFVANVYNIPLSFSTYCIIIVTTMLTAMSTAGVPSAGMLTLAMVLKQAGLPVESSIGLLFGIDRLIDIFRTVVNITGDTVVALIVSSKNSTINKKIYQNDFKKSSSL